ncbi:hypothetical protein NL676_025192 [Syzygium grande]|nr:hypothetical protein NL676_025192 [Syzygium grande]
MNHRRVSREFASKVLEIFGEEELEDQCFIVECCSVRISRGLGSGCRRGKQVKGVNQSHVFRPIYVCPGRPSGARLDTLH